MYNQKFSKIKRCKKCQGTGKLRVGNLREMHNHDVIDCPYCEGEGQWIQITTIEYVKISPELIQPLIPVA